MRGILLIVLVALLGGCAAPRSYTRPTPFPLTDAFSCALDQMEEIVRGVTSRFHVKAAALTTFTPARDEDDRTLRAGLRVLDLLGDYAAGA